MERRFELGWETGLRVTTALFVLLLLGVGAGVPWLAWRDAHGDAAALPGVLLPLLAVAVALPLAWALAPRALVLRGASLVVERALRPVEIPLGAIRAVGRVTREQVGGMVRTWGSGGAFGYYGRFHSRGLGAVRLAATRRDGYVVIDTEAARWLVTPDEPDRFVAALLRAAPRAAALAPGAPLRPRPRSGRRLALVLLASLAGVAALAGIVLALVWAWAPRAVRADGDVVVVERHWAGPISIALRPDAPPPRRLAREELRGLRKRAGSNLGAVRSGTYATDALGPFQLHAPRAGQHWLLETPHGKVVVVPDDQEAFEAWARGRGAVAP
jgi:hypothetical protein